MEVEGEYRSSSHQPSESCSPSLVRRAALRYNLLVNSKAKFLTLSFSLFLSLAASAQTPGQLTPKVVTKADAQQSYALYLPANFEASHRWPVLYLFDPGARGEVATEK